MQTCVLGQQFPLPRQTEPSGQQNGCGGVVEVEQFRSFGQQTPPTQVVPA